MLEDIVGVVVGGETTRKRAGYIWKETRRPCPSVVAMTSFSPTSHFSSQRTATHTLTLNRKKACS